MVAGNLVFGPMDWMQTLQIDRLAVFAHGHVREISYAMATSFVVILSRPIDGLVSRMVGRWHFLLRTLAWILIFTAGYTLLASWSERILRGFLGDQKPTALLVLTVLGFVGFGVWASESRNHK